MSAFKLKGAIKVIGQTRQVSDKFKTREFVVTDSEGMYPQDIMFQVNQDKVSLLDTFMEGQIVEVSFNIRGREWTSPQGEVKYFNTLEAWRIDAQGEASPAAAPQGEASPAADDLPF